MKTFPLYEAIKSSVIRLAADDLELVAKSVNYPRMALRNWAFDEPTKGKNKGARIITLGLWVPAAWKQGEDQS